MRWAFFCFSGLPVWAQQKAVQPNGKPLPASFDLRTVHGVTPVKQQSGGTCWAHGTMAAIESNLILSGDWKSAGLDGLPALSEYHLDWWNGFNKHRNLDLPEENKDKTGLSVHVGGDYRVAAAYMTRGEGVVLVPRGPDKQLDIKGWYKEPPAQDAPSYKRFYVRDIEWFVVGDNLENIDVIKRRIMTEGAIGTSYAVSKSFMLKDNFHYQPASSQAKQNHAVAIVGWDDDKIDADKKAPKPGAWLIKNSWGTKTRRPGLLLDFLPRQALRPRSGDGGRVVPQHRADGLSSRLLPRLSRLADTLKNVTRPSTPTPPWPSSVCGPSAFTPLLTTSATRPGSTASSTKGQLSGEAGRQDRHHSDHRLPHDRSGQLPSR